MPLKSKKEYYYLVAGLPDMLLDESKLKLTSADLKSDWQELIDPDDFELIEALFRKFDNHNLLNLLLKNEKPFDERGNYALDFLEDQVKEPVSSLPAYLSDFIIDYKADNREDASKSWETILEERFYDHLLSLENDFLREWFELELNLGNVLTGLNCRKHNLSMESQMIGTGYIVENILRSKARDFGLSQDFPEVDQVIAAWESNNLLEREKALDVIRWQWIEENVFFHYFTIERLLGFLLQLEMVERWLKLDHDEGERLFRELLKHLGSSYKLPQEFELQHITRK
jgi:hypothetical protein